MLPQSGDSSALAAAAGRSRHRWRRGDVVIARARLGLARCRARAAAAAGPADFGPPPRRRRPSSVADWRSQPPEPPQQLPQRRGAGAWACPSGQPAAAASRLHVFPPCSVLVWGRPGGAPPSPPARLKPPRAASHHIIYRPAQELLQETRVSQQVQTQFVHTHTHSIHRDRLQVKHNAR